MSIYDSRPWLHIYGDKYPGEYSPTAATALEMFHAGLQTAPDGVAIKYFDGTITRRELDRLSDAFAAALAARGFEHGDRLGIYLQNVPQFLIAVVGAWKVGAIVVCINPMNRERELTYMLTDSGAKALVCLESLHRDVARHVLQNTAVELVITTSELEYQTRRDSRLFDGVQRQECDGTLDMSTLVESYRDKPPPGATVRPDDPAMLCYTSGTTGSPKGAINTHRNVAAATHIYKEWVGLTPDGSILGVAPLFHITGLIAHVSASLAVPVPLVLAYRFHPDVILDAIREHKPTFTVGSITVFIALMNTAGASAKDFRCFKSIFSGGAPVSPATANAFEAGMGTFIHNSYGLTEATAPAIHTPRGMRGPVDPDSGALSVGVPMPGMIVRIADEEENDLPPGQLGEIIVEGPNVVPGYWNKPEETDHALRGGRMRTGDIGFMTEDGWFFVVDRKKDLINASGYKVWPREVEDVLYEHSAVREAAVVGVPDEYRGETVKAFVSLRTDASVTSKELIEFAKQRLSAYKCPRAIEILDELPKTLTGKILRRELRKV
ncbi:MAG: AMP-binding protein [Ectothiorhodospiraceae bacterium]|nr:AMP-binding protein [Ectothiorhodospiraceae bacterium]